jgi:ribosomal protein S18 acetylase RimI-like enzyme
MGTVPRYALRRARVNDDPFLRTLHAHARRDEIAAVDWTEDDRQQFLREQYEAQRTFFDQQYPHARHDIVLSDGEPVGRLWVNYAEDEIRVLDWALVPRSRGAGIGTALIRELQADARRLGVPITSTVAHVNPRARALYERHGFRVVGRTPMYAALEWSPTDEG